MRKPIPIHDEPNDRWNVLMPDGRMLTWATDPWRSALLAFSCAPDTITQDADGMQLSNVAFPSKVEAELGILILRTYIQADRKIKEFAGAFYGR